MCTESEFYRHSFGDGVSESESDDDEYHLALSSLSPLSPTAGRTSSLIHIGNNSRKCHNHTPSCSAVPAATESHSPNPQGVSRGHSPVSDMDISSKRNSQVSPIN